MTRVLRIVSRALIAVAVAAGIAVAGLYALAFGSLEASGPNPSGYGLLEAANRSVPWIAVLAAFGVLTSAAGSAFRRVIVPAASLALASGVLGAFVAGTWTLARFLAHVHPTAQPPALNSFILAIAGSAQDVAPAAIVLALAAVTLVAIRGVAGVRSRRAVVGATA
jgi:hypothetical protein